MAGESGESASAALRRRGLQPRKRLGQNFLRDRSFLRSIVEAAEIEPGDRVLEIGPGTGVLTRALVDAGAQVTAVELDDALIEHLRLEFGDELAVVHANALDFDPCRDMTAPYKLVGNIPYYITGPILRHYLESSCSPSLLVLMVQREVAERMTAQPGDMSLLAVSVQFYATPRVVRRVPAGAFYPPPRVQSAIVKLTPHGDVPLEVRDALFAVAHAGFGTRRKQLANSLSAGLSLSRREAVTMLEEAGIDPSRRAETLAVSDWLRLARIWRNREA